MTRSSLFLFPLAAALGCGGLTRPDEYEPPPLVTLEATVTGALGPDLPGELRGALLWSAYEPALLACLDEVPAFTPPLDPLENPEHEAIWYALGLCAQLHLTSTVESDSVAIEPQLPASFTLPITALPPPTILSGNEGARMGLAAVDVYADGNHNGRLDLLPPGTLTSDDVVLGSSAAVDDEDLVHSLVVFREGAVSPLWKLLRGLYNCTGEPPVGFSVLTVQFDDVLGDVTCTVGPGPVPVRLDDSAAMRSEVCQPTPYFGVYVPPGDEGIPGGAVMECDSSERVFFSTTADAVCPLVGRYDLIGCTDTSSEDACADTFFDHTASPPAWWPCNSSGMFLHAVAEFATADVDVIATLEARGTTMVTLADIELEVEIDGDETFLPIPTSALTLVDRDGNGWLNAGDEVVVREPGDVFHPASPPGIYRVRGQVAGAELYETGYSPVPLAGDALPQLAFDLEGGEVLTDAPGEELFRLRATGGEGTWAVADLAVEMRWACEIPVMLGAELLTLIDDADGDGRFGAGDTLAVSEPTDLDELNGLGLLDGGGSCVDVQARLGVNHYGSISGYGLLWSTFSGDLIDDPAPLTASLDRLASFVLDGAQAVASAGDITAYWLPPGAQQLEEARLGQEALFVDVNGDGLVSVGDRIDFVETAPLFDGPARLEVYMNIGETGSVSASLDID